VNQRTFWQEPVFPTDGLFRQKAIVCFALAAVTFIVFGQAWQFDFINFDDDDYVVNNPAVNHGLTLSGIAWAFTHFHAANWHPLTWISHMADCQLYGLQPGGHHVTSVLIHAATVIALFLFLLEMTGAFWRCAFVAAVFAIHPLRVESVAWVAERKDVLSGLFFVLTIGAYARYARQPWSAARYGLVVLLFVMGLMCKPMLVTLPLVLLLLDYWPLQRTKPVSRLILEKLPLLAISAISSVITLFAQKGALRPIETFPLKARVVAAVLSYKIYLIQMIYPAGLAAFYPFPHNVSVFGEVMAGMLLAIISVFVWAERHTKPWLLVGWLWYLIMLLPVIGIVQAGAQSHADRYTYLPQIGIYIAVTWLAAELAVKWRVNSTAMGGVTAAVVTALMLCAWKQTGYWRNSETLWEHALACTTDNDVACVNLGHELYKNGRLDEAIALYQKALETQPDDPQYLNNLANALREEGKMNEAISQYEKAVQIEPDFADAQFNLGKALGQTGKEDEAIARFRMALQIDPNFLLARINLGNALLQMGKVNQAAAQLQKVLETEPKNAGIHLNLGLCYFQLGQIKEALLQYEQALQINPADPRIQNNLAWLLAAGPVAALRDGNQAVELAEEANEITEGEDPVVLHTLAAALAQAGRFPEAIETAQEAAHLAEARSNPALASQLQSEIKLYEASRPFPFSEKDHSAENQAAGK
jgi:tetratricopeptide (TPR) repeat protein